MDTALCLYLWYQVPQLSKEREGEENLCTIVFENCRIFVTFLLLLYIVSIWLVTTTIIAVYVHNIILLIGNNILFQNYILCIIGIYMKVIPFHTT